MAVTKIKAVVKPRDRKDALELVKQHGVKFVRLWFTDIHGQLKSFAVPVSELEFAFNEGMGTSASSVLPVLRFWRICFILFEEMNSTLRK